MTELEKNTVFETYNNRTHVIGRISSIVVVLMLAAMPFLMGVALNTAPNLPAFWSGFLSIGPIWIATCVVEYALYTPIVGAGGSYLAFITGNLVNMKIPCAMDARDTVNAKVGTPENEIISTLSIATSSLVTLVVLTVGVILLIPLQPVLESPALQPAFENVVPALFGALAYKYFRKNLKIAVLPFVVMSVLCILIPALVAMTNYMLFPGIFLSIATAWILYRKMQKKKETGDLL